MDLSKIAIKARTRNAWQAIDMGFFMTRRWWATAFLSWAIPATLIYGIATFLLYNSALWAASVIVWWLKPLLDRGPLFVASRRLFGETPSMREILFELPRLYRTDSIKALTLYRLSLTRSFDLPLTVLESARGVTRSSRQAILHRGHGGAATWLTIVGIHVELIIIASIYFFIYFMLADFLNFEYQSIIEPDNQDTLIYNSFYFFAMILVSPFYVIAGFAMYISRRIELEAWDIEIRFRQFATKGRNTISNVQAQTLTVVSASLLAAMFTVATPENAYAESPYSETTNLNSQSTDWKDTTSVEAAIPSATDSQNHSQQTLAKKKILQVLEGEEFHKKVTEKGIRLKSQDKVQEEDKVPDWLIRLVEWIDSLFESTDGLRSAVDKSLPILEVVIWVSVALLILFLALKYQENIRTFVTPPNNRERGENESPTVMFGLDISKESLPADIPNAVERLWTQGEHRSAISLLYRGLLSQLIHNHGFKFLDSHTEGECVEIVRQKKIDALTSYTESITRAWQIIAYGHITPDSSQIQTLCQQWPVVLEQQATETAS